MAMPTPTPDSARPTSSSGPVVSPAAMSSDPMMENTGAASITGLRPMRSDNGPEISSAGAMPRA